MQLSKITLLLLTIGLVACGGGLPPTDEDPNTETADNSDSDATTSIESFTEAEQRDIDTLIREYILENPEVLIEAVQRHSAEQQAQAEENARIAMAESLDQLLDPKTGFVSGKDEANAKVAVIEFYDYNCGFCKRAAPLVRDIVEKDEDVKISLRELPIFGGDSDYAAELSLAALSTGKFLDFHLAMMSTSGRVTEALVKQLAEQQGLNVEALEAEVASGSVAEAITINKGIAESMNIGGTPAFIVATLDGEFIRAIAGFDPAQIMNAIAEAKEVANAG